MDMASRDSVRERLEARGVTPTRQRLDVGCVLFARPQHLSADQVIDLLRGIGARVSKATVYNTLDLFAERGLVQAVTIDPNCVYYEPHHHFYNVDTGELTDIAPGDIEIARLPALPAGTSADGVHVIVQVRNAD